jgi:hypothetical protein
MAVLMCMCTRREKGVTLHCCMVLWTLIDTRESLLLLCSALRGELVPREFQTLTRQTGITNSVPTCQLLPQAPHTRSTVTTRSHDCG